MDRPSSWTYEEDPLYRRYRQLHLIGVGKYSEVYAGEDVVTNQEVALKIIDKRKVLEEEGAREEYRRLSALCHRNIVSGLAFFRSSPQPHLDTIVITRVNGIQIFKNISHKQISEGELKSYFQQLLSALDYLVTQEIVHGDIKPENILVDNGGTVRLIDFGTSHPDPEFSAPEVHSSNLSPAADIWSFGVLVYAALSGVSPFLDDCPEETYTNKCNANFSFPSEYFGCTPDSATSFISHLLIPDPLQRPVPQTLNNHPWFLQDESEWVAPAERLRNFIFRRRKSSYSGL